MAAYGKLLGRIAALKPEDGGVDQAVFDEYKAKFLQQMGNDLNTSMGITAVFDVLKAKTSDATKLALIGDFDTVLSLDLLEKAEKIRQEPGQGLRRPSPLAAIPSPARGTRLSTRWFCSATRLRRPKTLPRRTGFGTN